MRKLCFATTILAKYLFEEKTKNIEIKKQKYQIFLNLCNAEMFRDAASRNFEEFKHGECVIDLRRLSLSEVPLHICMHLQTSKARIKIIFLW